MTSEQQKAVERLDCYIAREGLTSVMNNTKWSEAIQALREVVPGLRFRVKVLGKDEPPADYWEGSFPHHLPHPYKFIEWLEINPVVKQPRGRLVAPVVRDFKQAAVEALQANSIPFEMNGTILLIQGLSSAPAPTGLTA